MTPAFGGRHKGDIRNYTVERHAALQGTMLARRLGFQMLSWTNHETLAVLLREYAACSDGSKPHQQALRLRSVHVAVHMLPYRNAGHGQPIALSQEVDLPDALLLHMEDDHISGRALKATAMNRFRSLEDRLLALHALLPQLLQLPGCGLLLKQTWFPAG